MVAVSLKKKKNFFFFFFFFSFFFFFFIFFFFQAEDGIRDLVRSRGLGDVYKRQLLFKQQPLVAQRLERLVPARQHEPASAIVRDDRPVSYTHLTLPTILLV